ncbi:MAG: MFS transporter, partial [Novosphingobium sp.]
NLIGLGLGPVLLGYCSDLLKPTYGTESVRYVLFVAALASLVAGGLLWRARKYLPGELDRYAAT